MRAICLVRRHTHWRTKHGLVSFFSFSPFFLLIFLFFLCSFTISDFPKMTCSTCVTRQKEKEQCWAKESERWRRKAEDFVNKIRRKKKKAQETPFGGIIKISFWTKFFRKIHQKQNIKGSTLWTFKQTNLSEMSKAAWPDYHCFRNKYINK